MEADRICKFSVKNAVKNSKEIVNLSKWDNICKAITEKVVLIACLCLDVNCVFKLHLSGYICFPPSMCSGYGHDERSIGYYSMVSSYLFFSSWCNLIDLVHCHCKNKSFRSYKSPI